MEYKVRPSCYTDEWVVEVWEEKEGTGEMYLAAFSGPCARERAIEYAFLRLTRGYGLQRIAGAWIHEQSAPASNGATRGSLRLTRLASGGKVPSEP